LKRLQIIFLIYHFLLVHAGNVWMIMAITHQSIFLNKHLFVLHLDFPLALQPHKIFLSPSLWKGDPRNLLAVVLSREEHGYKLGTKSGVLRGLYTRNQFELSDNNFLAKDTSIFLNKHLFVLHLDFPLALQPHFVKPWPSHIEASLTACLREISVSS
jgi:hypothetical protein